MSWPLACLTDSPFAFQVVPHFYGGGETHRLSMKHLNARRRNHSTVGGLLSSPSQVQCRLELLWLRQWCCCGEILNGGEHRNRWNMLVDRGEEVGEESDQSSDFWRGSCLGVAT